MTAVVTGRIGCQVEIGADTFFECPCFGGRTRLRDTHGGQCRIQRRDLAPPSLFLSNLVTRLLWLGVLIPECASADTGGQTHSWVAPDLKWVKLDIY